MPSLGRRPSASLGLLPRPTAAALVLDPVARTPPPLGSSRYQTALSAASLALPPSPVSDRRKSALLQARPSALPPPPPPLPSYATILSRARPISPPVDSDTPSETDSLGTPDALRSARPVLPDQVRAPSPLLLLPRRESAGGRDELDTSGAASPQARLPLLFPGWQ
jgi:hypothetical protein